jgi:hypothetical protein
MEAELIPEYYYNNPNVISETKKLYLVEICEGKCRLRPEGSLDLIVENHFVKNIEVLMNIVNSKTLTEANKNIGLFE